LIEEMLDTCELTSIQQALDTLIGDDEAFVLFCRPGAFVENF
jgi:hypothetical protein